MSQIREFYKGLYIENPIFRIVLGLCPTLAVSNSMRNAVGMGLAATFVLVCSNVIVSLIRKGVPNKIRIPIYIVVIATFVTIVDLFMAGFAPDLHKALGIFVPLIVVNCIILGRAEAFAGKNKVFASFLDGLGMGVGFTLALLLLGTVREILGDGKFFGFPVLGAKFEPML
ncbi:MAG: electron transport complex subunit E, partial [candidate division KSB1 bacterium]|nr:electron transport complex subunit E [candidate division KSB1 bacterium]